MTESERISIPDSKSIIIALSDRIETCEKNILIWQ